MPPDLKYKVEIFWSYDDQEFVAIIPELKGCSASGSTRSEALKEVLIAMKLWIDHAEELKEDIPTPKSTN